MNKKGFTLLEVLVGTAVLAMMVFLIWSVSSSTLDSEARVYKRDEVFQMARFALRKIGDDMSMAFLVANQDLLGKTKDGSNVTTGFMGTEEGGFAKVDFTAFSHWRMFRDAKESEQSEVGYTVRQDEEDPEVNVLIRRESPIIDNDITEGGKIYALAYGVADFKMEYYDGQKEDWSRDWRSTDAEHKDKMPKAVRVKLSFTDPDGGEEPIEFTTVIYINLWKFPVEF